MTTTTVLLVEDDVALAQLIRNTLSSEKATLVHAPTAREGWRLIEAIRPALVILDVGLPDESGLEVCKKIREHPTLKATPVILLTAKAQFSDKEKGFEAGADHYLIKPIQIQELQLWANALLRRVNLADEEGGIIRARDFTVDPQTHRVTAAGQVIDNLTRKEFELLYELVRNQPKVLSKHAILNSLWNTVLRDNTVEVHVKNLRAKLGEHGKRIETVPGVGYRFS